MRHCFYPVVALIGFLIGTFTVSLWFQQEKESLQTVAENQAFALEESKSSALIRQQTNQVEFICEDKNLQFAWLALKQSLFGYRIPNGQINCADYLILERAIDLNDDGIMEAIIKRKDDCADVCTNLWVLEKQNNGQFKIILDDVATSFEIKKSRTNGYRDFVVGYRYQFDDSYGFNLYKFDGEYVLMKCWEIIYSVKDKNGTSRKLKKPRKNYLHCC